MATPFKPLLFGSPDPHRDGGSGRGTAGGVARGSGGGDLQCDAGRAGQKGRVGGKLPCN